MATKDIDTKGSEQADERKAAIRRLIEAEAATFTARNKRSAEWCHRAVYSSMPLGAPTNVCMLNPYPLLMKRGKGAHIKDADGHTLIDYNGGYGALPCGHAHPAILKAVRAQISKGTHYGTLTEPVTLLAEHVCQRFSLDWVRFSASGTEATMDAIRLARAHTGRSLVVKCEGAYHGSHVDAMVSINQAADGNEGPDDDPHPRPADESIPQRAVEGVLVVPFNDLGAAQRAISSGDVACMIVEPIMFNIGHVAPAQGYLEGLRQACEESGALLIFDEVKTAPTIAYGGAEELYGVKPHVKCFAKSVFGGFPGGAFGGTDKSGETFNVIQDFHMLHVGTFSGNPVSASAGLAALTQVLTEEGMEGLHAHGEHLAHGLRGVIAAHHLPAYVTHVGAKGCLVWSDHELRDFRDYDRSFDGEIAYLAWLRLLNNGIFLPPGHDEQWTHSVAHTEADADAFIAAFDAFADFAVAEGLFSGKPSS
jgi:glutamate-1-semialdehyde 2,1-aminomutase